MFRCCYIVKCCHGYLVVVGEGSERGCGEEVFKVTQIFFLSKVNHDFFFISVIDYSF